MFGTNDTQTMDLIYKVYMLLSRGFTAWLKLMQSLFNA